METAKEYELLFTLKEAMGNIFNTYSQNSATKDVNSDDYVKYSKDYFALKAALDKLDFEVSELSQSKNQFENMVGNFDFTQSPPENSNVVTDGQDVNYKINYSSDNGFAGTEDSVISGTSDVTDANISWTLADDSNGNMPGLPTSLPAVTSVTDINNLTKTMNSVAQNFHNITNAVSNSVYPQISLTDAYKNEFDSVRTDVRLNNANIGDIQKSFEFLRSGLKNAGAGIGKNIPGAIIDSAKLYKHATEDASAYDEQKKQEIIHYSDSVKNITNQYKNEDWTQSRIDEYQQFEKTAADLGSSLEELKYAENRMTDIKDFLINNTEIPDKFIMDRLESVKDKDYNSDEEIIEFSAELDKNDSVNPTAKTTKTDEKIEDLRTIRDDFEKIFSHLPKPAKTDFGLDWGPKNIYDDPTKPYDYCKKLDKTDEFIERQHDRFSSSASIYHDLYEKGKKDLNQQTKAVQEDYNSRVRLVQDGVLGANLGDAKQNIENKQQEIARLISENADGENDAQIASSDAEIKELIKKYAEALNEINGINQNFKDIPSQDKVNLINEMGNAASFLNRGSRGANNALRLFESESPSPKLCVDESSISEGAERYHKAPASIQNFINRTEPAVKAYEPNLKMGGSPYNFEPQSLKAEAEENLELCKNAVTEASKIIGEYSSVNNRPASSPYIQVPPISNDNAANYDAGQTVDSMEIDYYYKTENDAEQNGINNPLTDPKTALLGGYHNPITPDTAFPSTPVYHDGNLMNYVPMGLAQNAAAPSLFVDEPYGTDEKIRISNEYMTQSFNETMNINNEQTNMNIESMEQSILGKIPELISGLIPLLLPAFLSQYKADNERREMGGTA